MLLFSQCMLAGVQDSFTRSSTGGELDTFISNDGGATWIQSGSPTVGAYEVFDLKCPTATRCYVITSMATTKGDPFKLFVTEDGD